MTRITAPPHGANYKIKKSGYVEGIYYVNGRPVTRVLRPGEWPKALSKIALFPWAWGEKNSVTSSSKMVRPVAPSRSASAEGAQNHIARVG